MKQRVAALWLVLLAVATVSPGVANSVASEPRTSSAGAGGFAAAVNLRASDVPGFKVTLNGGLGHAGPLDQWSERCDGSPVLNMDAHGQVSPIFQKPSSLQTILSAVYFVGDSSVAARYTKAASSERGPNCLRRDELRESILRRHCKVHVP